MSRTKTTATDGGTGGGKPEETLRSRYVKGEEQMQTGKAALKRNKNNNKTTSIFKLFHQLLLSLFLDWVPMTREDTALRENLYIQL